MATSATRAEPGVHPTDVLGVIGDLQAAGSPITAEGVYREMRRREMPCRRSTVQAAVRTWHQQQQAGGAEVVVLDPPAAEAPAPVARSEPPRLFAAMEAYRAAVVAREAAQRQEQDAARELQQVKVAARAAVAWLHERSRVARMAPTHELAAALAAIDKARAALAVYVGSMEATRAANDLSYRPAGL